MSTSNVLSFVGDEVGDGEQANGEEFWEGSEWVPGGFDWSFVDRRDEVDLADEQQDDDDGEGVHSER